MVPLLVEESTSRELLDLFASDPVLVVWWATEVEATSAVARLERSLQLEVAAAAEALSRLQQFSAAWHEVQPSLAVRDFARRLLRVHDLRTADSLQLAAAIVAAENQPATLPFVSLDARLADAARREGFPVLPLAAAAPVPEG